MLAVAARTMSAVSATAKRSRGRDCIEMRENGLKANASKSNTRTIPPMAVAAIPRRERKILDGMGAAVGGELELEPGTVLASFA
jgi:hypothetical protein